MITINLSKAEAAGLIEDISDVIDNAEMRSEYLEELLTSIDFRLEAQDRLTSSGQA